jgi:hypothetical protein
LPVIELLAKSRSLRTLQNAMSSVDARRRSGGIDGRPLGPYIASKVAESAARASSASFFTRRSGWSARTRCSGETRLNIVV